MTREIRLGPFDKITADIIEDSRKDISEYTAKAEIQEEKVETGPVRSRRAYGSHASRNRTNAARMQANLDIQLAWLKRYNRPLYDEVTNEK